MKKAVITAIQIFVTLGILFWIFHDPHKRAQMYDAITHASPMWIIAGVLAYGVVEILGAFRWMVLLRVQGINVPWYRLGALLMIGIFFNQIMPGGTGGDVVKIFYLLKETPNKKTQALLAVLIDRLIGLIGLIIVAGVVIVLRWSWLTQGQQIPHFEFAWLFNFSQMKLWLGLIPNSTKLLYTLLFILGGTVLGIAVSFVITGLGLAHKLPARFPKRDIFIDLSVAYGMYGRAWKASLLAIFLSFGVHICSFLLFYSAAKAIGTAIPLLDFCAIMPIINTIASLPISVGGLGVRETLFQTMLNTLSGVKITDAYVISLLGAAMVLFWGLVGSVIYIFYRPSTQAAEAGPEGPVVPPAAHPVSPLHPAGGPTLKEMVKEVHALEHEIAESAENPKPTDS